MKRRWIFFGAVIATLVPAYLWFHPGGALRLRPTRQQEFLSQLKMFALPTGEVIDDIVAIPRDDGVYVAIRADRVAKPGKPYSDWPIALVVYSTNGKERTVCAVRDLKLTEKQQAKRAQYVARNIHRSSARVQRQVYLSSHPLNLGPFPTYHGPISSDDLPAAVRETHPVSYCFLVAPSSVEEITLCEVIGYPDAKMDTPFRGTMGKEVVLWRGTVRVDRDESRLAQASPNAIRLAE